MNCNCESCQDIRDKVGDVIFENACEKLRLSLVPILDELKDVLDAFVDGKICAGSLFPVSYTHLTLPTKRIV